MSNELYVNASGIEVFPYTQQPVEEWYKEITGDAIITVAYYNTLSKDDQAKYKYQYKIQEHRDGRVLSEENIALLISRITNNASYVISETLSVLTARTEIARSLEFILGGRYFKVTENADSGYNVFAYDQKDSQTGISTRNGMSLWVKAVFDESIAEGTPAGYKVLKGVDGITFGGLEFKYASEDLTSERYFKLLEPEGKIPVASRFRMNSSAIQNINGGTV